MYLIALHRKYFDAEYLTYRFATIKKIFKTKRKMRKIYIAVFCLMATLVILSGCKKSSTSLVGNWIRRGDFGGPARSDAVSFVIGNKAYICSGYGVDVSLNYRHWLNDLWEYTPKTDSWTQKASLPDSIFLGRIGATAFSINTKAYVGLGQDSISQANLHKDFWQYDQALDTWTRKSDFLGVARSYAVSFSINDTGYVGTGTNGNLLKDFYKYNPVGDSWTQIPDIGGYKRYGASAFVINGKGYVCLGLGDDGYSSDFWMYDPAIGAWKAKRQTKNATDSSFDDQYGPIDRMNAVAFVINSKGYVTTGSNGSALTDAWEYDPVNDLWAQKTSFEGSARYGAAAFSVENRGFVLTGRNGTPRFEDVWEFDPTEAYNANDK